MSCDNQSGMCCCKSVLDLDKLCADCAQICWLKVKKEYADKIVANDVCSQVVSGNQVNANNLNANNMCSQQGTINKLCVNDLTVGNLNHCSKYRAAVTFSSDNTYTLGQPVNWNVIIDDPNGNVSLLPVFTYTVPVSGYYILSFQLDSDSLSGASLITGIPVGAQSVLVNGGELRTQYQPYLSFTDRQKASLTNLCLLNAGDVVTMLDNVLVLNQSSGLINYVGSLNIEANGSFPGQSGFAIHYLSSLNCSPVMCVTCPPVQIACNPVVPPSDCDDCDEPVGMHGCDLNNPK